VLLTVVPHVAANPVAPATAAVAREIEGDFAKCLHRVTAALPADIGVECRIARGKPAPRILDIAGEMNADLIVIGSRGHGRLHDALTGCTSAAVVRESKVPVLLVRGDRTKGPGPFVRSEAIEDPMPAPVDPA
jgi:nucleotide-binding universal stress UspA family protein